MGHEFEKYHILKKTPILKKILTIGEKAGIDSGIKR
jgi:hypothetical protein